MRDIEEVEHDLKRQITEVIVPLQTMRQVSRADLEGLVARAAEGASVLKGREQLPRSFLNEVYVLIQVLRHEAPHSRIDGLVDIANRLELLFALILRGEALEDRTPGVPRVI